MYCGQCGRQIENASRFCEFCGNQIYTITNDSEPVDKWKKATIIISCFSAVIILTLTILLIVSSCGKQTGQGDVAIQSSIVGKWKRSDGKYLDFKQSGKVVYYFGDYWDDPKDTEYTVENGVLHFNKSPFDAGGLVPKEYNNFIYSEKAKENSKEYEEGNNYWYIEGDTLYICKHGYDSVTYYKQ